MDGCTNDDGVGEEAHDGAELFGEGNRGVGMRGWWFRRRRMPRLRGERSMKAIER